MGEIAQHALTRQVVLRWESLASEAATESEG